VLLFEEVPYFEDFYNMLEESMQIDTSSRENLSLAFSIESKNDVPDDERYQFDTSKKASQKDGILSSGFKTPEALIEELGEPDHEKYFLILEELPKENPVAKKKLMILYSLFYLRQQQSGVEKLSFIETIKKFWADQDADSSDRVSSR